MTSLSRDNRTLQAEIAYWFVTQATTPATQGIIRGTPVEILDRLIKELKPGASDTYTVGVYAPPGIGGGHAVTPFAVENIDNNIFHVLVYDNNHPGKTRRLIIDRQRNRHVAFGSGIHRCAGSNLARLEMTVALRVWLERIPEFSLREGEEMAWAGGQVRGPRVMPFEFPAGSKR